MILRDHFEHSGNWLFRWRSYLPLSLLGVALLVIWYAPRPEASPTLSHRWQLVCLGVMALGLGIRAVAIGHAPAGTSGSNTREQVARSLTTSGLYSIVRHPLYLGNLLIGLGLALFPGSWGLVLFYAGVFWLYYERIIFAEEAFLEREFGEVFLAWARRTPAFLPRLRQYRAPELPFSLRAVLHRESTAVLVNLSAMFLLEETGAFRATGQVGQDPLWLGLMAGLVVLWVLLRVLKKTHRLDTQGR